MILVKIIGFNNQSKAWENTETVMNTNMPLHVTAFNLIV